EQMIQEFQNITPEEGRQMVKDANILLLPNWDIADALIFNSVSNNLGLQDPNKKEFLGTAFSNDQAALVMWSLRRGSIQNPLLTAMRLKLHIQTIALELISAQPSPAHPTLVMTQKPFSPPPYLPLRSITKAVESIVCQMHLLSEQSHLIHTPMDDRHITKLRRFHLLDTNSLAQQPLYPRKSLFMRSSLQISTIGYIRMHLQEIKHALIDQLLIALFQQGGHIGLQMPQTIQQSF
ncbi:hypothetical protein, partial [Enterobacter hormaechei]|uniref:hypothetical protein n=1 Tax=Enterobacter hormaechei TaxID=158836 RepID=UPI0023E3FE8C